MITFAAIQRFAEDNEGNPLADAWADMVYDAVELAADRWYYEPKEYLEEAEEGAGTKMSAADAEEYLRFVEVEGGWPPLEGWEADWA